MDRREHHRAQLRLPVRIRWNTPFGQKMELCKTLDISRSGLLVPSAEPHAPGIALWVTFPYDSSVGDGQPEILARVMRVGSAPNGNGNKTASETLHERTLGLHFALPFRPESNGNGHTKERERRGSPRLPVALPVRVRPEQIPWFEEAMTIDVSAHGLRFLSTREYQEGQRLLIAFEPTALAPWPISAETAAHVVRIEAFPESATLAVIVVRE